MSYVSISNIPTEYLEKLIAEDKKITINVVYQIIKTIEAKSEKDKITDVCKEMAQNGFIIGEIKHYICPELIRQYYYKFKSKK